MYPPSGGLEYQPLPTPRWTTTAAGPTGSAGNLVTLRWGFIADGVSIPSAGIGGANGHPGEVTSPSTLQASLNALYGSSTTWVPLFEQVFNRWSSLSGITFIYTGLSDDGAAFVTSPGVLGARLDIRIGGHHLDGPAGAGPSTLAYNYGPDFGDMVIDTSELSGLGLFTNTGAGSLFLRNTVAHELGHGLGLNHVVPVEETTLMEPNITAAFDGPQFDDILGIHAQYGDVYEKGTRNETAATASNVGTLNDQVNGGISAWVNPNNPLLPRSIANTSDVDYLKFTITSAKDLLFVLTPYGPGYMQGSAFNNIGFFNALDQGDLNFTLYGTDGTTVISNIDFPFRGAIESILATNVQPGTYYLGSSGLSGER